MNRRAFLLALGLSACGTPPAPKRRPRPRTREPYVSSHTPPPLDLGIETGPNPIAVDGDLLVQTVSDSYTNKSDLLFWNARTMARMQRMAMPHTGLCFLSDGMLAVFDDTIVTSKLHVFDRKLQMSTLSGPNLIGRTETRQWVLPGASPDNLYVSTDDAIERLRRTAHTFHRIDVIAPRDDGSMFPVASFGDGRLIIRKWQSFEVVAPDRPPHVYELPKQFLVHVAVGSRGRIWYTHSNAYSRNHFLVLARLLPGSLLTEKRIDFAGQLQPAGPDEEHAREVIIHIATSPSGAVAVLLRAFRGRGDESNWALVVLDHDGRERWRRPLPAHADDDKAVYYSYVAMSDERVIALRHDDALLAWDARSGDVVPVITA